MTSRATVVVAHDGELFEGREPLRCVPALPRTRLGQVSRRRVQHGSSPSAVAPTHPTGWSMMGTECARTHRVMEGDR